MSQDFFINKNNCSHCPLEKEVKAETLKRASKKNEFSIRSDRENPSNLDIIVLTDSVEKPTDIEKLFKLCVQKGLKNFAIMPAISCRCMNYDLPKPAYAAYAYCKSFKIEKYNPKVVITTGKAFMHFTKGDVFSSWRDFREFLFNETWFLPHIASKWKGRIYPAAFIQDIFHFDTFEHLHFSKQVEFAKKHVENYDKEKFVMPDYKVETVENFDEWITVHKDEPEVALDTETNSLNVFIDNFKVGCVQCSFDGITGYYLPMEIINKRKFSGWLNGKKQYLASGKYDWKALERERIFGVVIEEDIPLIFHILNTERDSNSIKVLAWLIGFGGYEDELDAYVRKYKVKDYLTIPKPLLKVYAALDAIVTFRLQRYVHQYLIHRQPEVYAMYREHILPVIEVFKDIETEGILVDKDYIKSYHEILVNKLRIVEQEIYDILGKKINIGSNDELGRALEEAGLPDYGRTLKGTYRTGEEILVQWERDGYKVIEKLLEYRKIAKLDGTYVGEELGEEDDDFSFNSFGTTKKKSTKEKGIYQYVMSDNRVHGNIMPAITDSLRSASNKPNLQNFVKKEEFRKVFIAPEGFSIGEADYAGFQLRLMGVYSQDPVMIEAFEKYNDLHSVTAQEFFCREVDIDTFIANKKQYKVHRDNGKEMNLAFCFGFTPFSFQTKINDTWTQAEILEFIENNKLEIIVEEKSGIENPSLTVATYLFNGFFKKYQRLQEYMNERIALACKQGYVDCTVFPGARRHLPELLAIGKELTKEKLSHYSNLKNIAINAEAQAGEALNVYIAGKKINDRIKKENLKSRLIGCVHDSLCFYIKDEEVKIMGGIIKECMERFDYVIPILCEIEVGKIWGFSPQIPDSFLLEKSNEYILDYIRSKI
jgi:DNA polymerase I-like protein with 3'-5' exonuclease and polymerase domains